RVADPTCNSIRWVHRRLSRHQRRASGGTASLRSSVSRPRGSVEPDGWARHSLQRAVRRTTGKRGGTAAALSSSWTTTELPTRTPMTYPKVSTDDSDNRAGDGVPSTPRFPQIEERVLAFWEGDDTLRASVEQRAAGEDGQNELVFYDGPPFANGLPHYGHLLTGYVQDLRPRYQTMRRPRGAHTA